MLTNEELDELYLDHDLRNYTDDKDPRDMLKLLVAQARLAIALQEEVEKLRRVYDGDGIYRSGCPFCGIAGYGNRHLIECSSSRSGDVAVGVAMYQREVHNPTVTKMWEERSALQAERDRLAAEVERLSVKCFVDFAAQTGPADENSEAYKWEQEATKLECQMGGLLDANAALAVRAGLAEEVRRGHPKDGWLGWSARYDAATKEDKSNG